MNKIVLIAFFLFASLFSFSQTRVEAENYTLMNGVSVVDGWGDGNARIVTSIGQGDWMEYTVQPTVSGLHTFLFRIGTAASGGQLKVKKTDGTVLANADLPNTTNDQVFQTVAVTLNLVAGAQTIRIESSAATQWNFNWFEYSFGYKFEAELYTAMNGIQLETTADVNGGQNVGWQDDGDWMDYSTYIATAGTYTVKFRVATQFTGPQFQLKKSDGTVLFTQTVPNTGTFQTWQTITNTVTLPAGQQTLRIYTSAANGGWNLNWWVLLPPDNPAPIVDAGADQTITLPTNSVNLSGSATDGNGTISSYAWTKISGPNTPTFGGLFTAATTVSNLVQGTYVFRLTATDNEGAPGMDEVTVTVNPASVVGGGQWQTNGNASDSTLNFIGTTNAQPLIFKTNNVKQAKLSIDGVFTTKKIKVTQIGWADFVFDSSYRLRDLKELEDFITRHHHLPEVPTTAHVKDNGVDIGESQAILLQKIEELTLYMIRLNKDVEKLRQENAELKKHLIKK